LYFKLYKSQLVVIEQALQTAGLMLGSDKSRGYCLEMICADFLAGANLQEGNPEALLLALGYAATACDAPSRAAAATHRAGGSRTMSTAFLKQGRTRLTPKE
jgi:hypothetical protein